MSKAKLREWTAEQHLAPGSADAEWIVTEGKERVCFVADREDAEEIARLAAAAPRLLLALQRVLLALDRRMPLDDFDGLPCVILAKVAIARAKGGAK